MSKLRVVYIFVLWSLLWISVSLLWGAFMFWDEMWTSAQHINLNSNWFVSSIKYAIESIKVGSNDSKDYSRFDKVLEVLKKDYYEPSKIDREKMLDNALKWFVDALEDPHTVYFTDSENQSFQENLEWEKDFEWIGAVVTKKERGVMIERVIKWAPSYKAGLKPLDIILKVEWKSTKNMSLSDAVSKIRWKKWTEVKLTIFRSSKEKDNIFEISVTRDSVSVPSVMWETYSLTWNKEIWYINISIIWEDTEKALKQVISDFDKEDLEWIVLDLRGNWWWYLPIAVGVSSHFVEKGEKVVSTKYRSLPNKSYQSKWYWDFEDTPIVILVDGITASAAEIISSALRYYNDAVLVGTQTFWKWSIQTMQDLKNWASLKFTIWKWFTPRGKNIDGEGLTPDVKVDVSSEDYKKSKKDPVLEKAKQKILEMIN